MVLYGITLFLSAFLLFLVQPLLGKYILPWFGGAPAVWTSCMLFFQFLLLGGYAYAHFITTRHRVRKQVLVHLVLLAASLATLPILPSGIGKPVVGNSPVLQVLGLLTVGAGAPYFMLASASPLLQAWLGRSRPGFSPYRLYSLSNLGSLLAIVFYPSLIEPLLPLGLLAGIWSWSYAVFTVLCSICALSLFRTSRFGAIASLQADPALSSPGSGAGARRVHFVLWLMLPACSSLMLLATTNQLCLDVAVIPLLWILPLGLYLISLIICFYSSRLYSRICFGILLAAALAWSCSVMYENVFAGIRTQIVSCSLTLFAASMVCHGELVRLKPDTGRLTAFYGVIAAGSVLGALFVTLLAPLIFKGYWEYPLGMLAVAVLFLTTLFFDRGGPSSHGRTIAAWIILSSAFLALAIAVGNYLQLAATGNIEMTRNFFGVARIFEENKGDPRFHRTILMHGRIQHGFQYQAPFRRNWPTSYYGPGSGIGIALRHHPLRLQTASDSNNLRIGVVGLGVGTLACYGRRGDYIRFYEINPEVVRLAGQYFSYLKNSAARVETVIGDARISMEQERERGDSQQFDVLALDAFNGDAVPVHLMTRECLEIYRAHLKATGILAVHISCKYFDLSPVARGLAGQFPGSTALLISSPRDQALGVEASEWVLLTANRQFLDNTEVLRTARPWTSRDLPPQVWTDDHNNLFRLLRNH